MLLTKHQAQSSKKLHHATLIHCHATVISLNWPQGRRRRQKIKLFSPHKATLMLVYHPLKKLYLASFSKLRAKMPKDEDDDEQMTSKGRTKRVTFALNEIHHEISDAEDIEEKRPVRKTVPSYALGRPLADYDATDRDVSLFIKKTETFNFDNMDILCLNIGTLESQQMIVWAAIRISTLSDQ